MCYFGEKVKEIQTRAYFLKEHLENYRNKRQDSCVMTKPDFGQMSTAYVETR